MVLLAEDDFLFCVVVLYSRRWFSFAGGFGRCLRFIAGGFLLAIGFRLVRLM